MDFGIDSVTAENYIISEEDDIIYESFINNETKLHEPGEVKHYRYEDVCNQYRFSWPTHVSPIDKPSGSVRSSRRSSFSEQLLLSVLDMSSPASVGSDNENLEEEEDSAHYEEESDRYYFADYKPSSLASETAITATMNHDKLTSGNGKSCHEEQKDGTEHHRASSSSISERFWFADHVLLSVMGVANSENNNDDGQYHENDWGDLSSLHSESDFRRSTKSERKSRRIADSIMLSVLDLTSPGISPPSDDDDDDDDDRSFMDEVDVDCGGTTQEAKSIISLDGFTKLLNFNSKKSLLPDESGRTEALTITNHSTHDKELSDVDDHEDYDASTCSGATINDKSEQERENIARKTIKGPFLLRDQEVYVYGDDEDGFDKFLSHRNNDKEEKQVKPWVKKKKRKTKLLFDMECMALGTDT